MLRITCISLINLRMVYTKDKSKCKHSGSSISSHSSILVSYLYQIQLLSCAKLLLAEGAKETANMVDLVYSSAD